MQTVTESKLKRLAEILKGKIHRGENTRYLIPELWNTFNYQGEELKTVGDGLIDINPYNYYYKCITNAILPFYDDAIDYKVSLANARPEQIFKKKGYKGGDWIGNGPIYCMHVRTTAAWDHDGNTKLEATNQYGFKETGTFLKAISLLPFLKMMGIETIYLLPIFKNSLKYKKGDSACPYAIKDSFLLDEALKDPMLGNEFSIEDEFAALVEACHIMGLRVVIDLVSRTAARDSELIINHPDWFYWVKTDTISAYITSIVETFRNNPLESASYDPVLEYLYSFPDTYKHLKSFTLPPDKLNPVKWEEITELYAADPSVDFLALIEKTYGITTMPGFCENPYDVQSPWIDNTFLRLYLDHPAIAAKYIGTQEEYSPYVFFDVIKAKEYPGKIKNQELWNYLSSILPFYQHRFGIDGVRIDMGHAIPGELVELMVSEARKIDLEFCFISESFENYHQADLNALGYNLFTGGLWEFEPFMRELGFQEINSFLDLELRHNKISIFAAAETVDSSRAATKRGGRGFTKLTTVLNNFIPNATPFFTSGIEVYELQPMNIDMDVSDDPDKRRNMLPKDDPQYGKIASFDAYALHWTNQGSREIPDLVAKMTKIRKQYLSTILNTENFSPVVVADPFNSGIGLAYTIDERNGKSESTVLLVVGNLDYENAKEFSIESAPIRDKAVKNATTFALLYSEFETDGVKPACFDQEGNLKLAFQPGEIKVMIL